MAWTLVIKKNAFIITDDIIESSSLLWHIEKARFYGTVALLSN